MIQGSQEWLDYRRKKIGASDAPVIMKISPWSTPYELWMEKLSGIGQVENAAMIRGKTLEKVALKRYLEMTGGPEMDSPVIENKEYPWQIASFDGMSLDRKFFVEIKCPGEKNHAEALAGRIPESYNIQIQHQLFVAGLDTAHYFSFDGMDGVIIEVKRNDTLLSDVFCQEERFWVCIRDNIPPDLMKKDLKKLQDKLEL